MKTHPHSLEPLEARIAPAAIRLSATTAIYTDVDGDRVTVTFSRPVLPDTGLATILVTTASGSGDQLLQINLLSGFLASAPGGMNITITAQPQDLTPGNADLTKSGDGRANLGYLKATNIDLGNVTIKGDLGAIDCGDGDAAQPALKTLSVRSMGRFGLATQAGLGDLVSDIDGRLGALIVAGDIKDAFIRMIEIGSVSIGGSLLGGSAEVSGSIQSSGDMGPVKIGQDLIGGAGVGSGRIVSDGKIGTVSIGGNVIGGSATAAGAISAALEVGAVKIGRDLIGGSGQKSGVVAVVGATGRIASVVVGGSIVGGAGEFSGSIAAGFDGASDADLGNVRVNGSVIGGRAVNSGSIFSDDAMGFITVRGDVRGGSGEDSGQIFAFGASPGVSVGGSLIGGSGEDSGRLVLNGGTSGNITIGQSVIGGGADSSGEIFVTRVAALSVRGDVIGASATGTDTVRAAGHIFAGTAGSITVGGSLIAGVDGTSGSFSGNGSIDATSVGTFTIKGSIVGNATHAASIVAYGQAATEPTFAIGRLTVGGSVEHAVIRTGLAGSSNNAQIGTVKIGGDWIASSLASGVSPGNAFFGDGDDTLVAGSISRIAAITLGGAIIGSGAFGDTFAFTAHQIDAFTAHGRKINLQGPVVFPGAFFSLETVGDVTLREL